MPRLSPLLPLLTAATGLALAGCGSDSSSSASGGSSGSDTSGPTKDFTPALTLLPRPATGKPGKSGRRITVAPKDSVVVVVHPPADAPKSGLLELRIPLGRAKQLNVKAGASGHPLKAQATVTGAGGRAVQLRAPRYVCRLEPTTFCPVKSFRRKQGAADMLVPLPLGAPLVVGATVG